MNNIPENILQQVADAAFAKPIQPRLTTRPYHLHDWALESDARRAVIQYALDNPALAPWLNVSQAWPQVVEYTDSDIHCAWRKAVESDDKFVDRIRAFLAALPRRESPALAEAIARAEKAEAELAALKSAQLGILRPIAEMPKTMPETVPEGCVRVSGGNTSNAGWIVNTAKHPGDTHFALLSLPAAEATPPVSDKESIDMQTEVANNLFGSVLPMPEPAAQVPLGPEDVPPGSVFRSKDQPDTYFWTVSQVWERGFYLRGECVDWRLAMERMEINTSLATGRWDANAWRPCGKPGK